MLDYLLSQAEESVSHVMGTIVDVDSGYEICDIFPSRQEQGV